MLTSKGLKQKIESNSSQLIKTKVIEAREKKAQEQQLRHRNSYRAQIYALNSVLQKLEIDNFEQLKLDIATGKVVLDASSYISDDSSTMLSPSCGIKAKASQPDHESRCKARSVVTTLRENISGNKQPFVRQRTTSWSKMSAIPPDFTSRTPMLRKSAFFLEKKLLTESDKPRFGGV